MDLKNTVSKAMQELAERRNQIKEEYVRAWLSSLPIDDIDLDWVLQNVELVEEWNDKRTQVRWYMRMRHCLHETKIL